ncbi:MAG: hypothetical protein IPO37_04945 [Saprospiraceae bacterium]|nr:hypothetical protein [Saprospiraceae bacterium]
MKTTRKNKGLYTIQFIILSLLMSVIIISCGGCKGSKVVTQADTKKKTVDSVVKGNEPKNDPISSTEFGLGLLKNAPMLPLEEVDITEVYDHYILEDTANNQNTTL